ncbi:MAG: pyrroline-5-carboxylate reductase [Treponemataceae bacterium]|uniref:pyrroline-5-carboxylate reductase n=1 Tax=Treponema sp. J25 TaxID=2094121 RepID=UPI00104AF5D1|nr:pyrroline-5-carboxylate reductase [Treponema sp. J25]MCX7949471.1 pyrroline-5-carboxylate reductase [Treponemataceae bacterium]TCW60088.1 pyrroline-5-carboxylate reductase [Treponema sp. J25]
MKYTLGCIGSGNMGSALMRAARRVLPGSALAVTDVNQEKARQLADELGANLCGSNEEVVTYSDFVLLAVKPQVLPQVLGDIAFSCKDRSLRHGSVCLVSVVAGWTIQKIEETLKKAAEAPLPEKPFSTDTVSGPHVAPIAAEFPNVSWNQPIIRLMPNTPALINQGMIAVTANSHVSAEQLATLEGYLQGAGTLDRIEERYFDAVTALSGSGPAYVYLFIEALADGGVRAGLPREKALQYAAQTVLGSAAMVLETGQHPGQLKDAVCSPAGTTIEALSVLESRAFRGTVMAAVDAAFQRARQLG